ALLTMAKASFLVTGGITVLVIACHRRSAWPVAAFAACLVTAWILLSQRIGDLLTFVVGGIDITSGYSSAVSLPVQPLWLASGIVTLFCMAVILCLAKVPLVFKLWVASMLFCVWKHSFVRAEAYHLASFFGFAPLAAIILGNVSGKASLPGKVSIIAAGLI